LKIVKQEYTPVPKNTIRIIVMQPDGKRVTLQTTTTSEYSLISGMVLFGAKERKPREAKRLQRSCTHDQSPQA
jgi:hypothetical protein